MKYSFFCLVIISQVAIAQSPWSRFASTPAIKRYPLLREPAPDAGSLRRDIYQTDAGNPGGRKNVGLSAMCSLLVPGLGEWYVGDYGVGKYFTIAEAALWLTWTGFQLRGDWVQTDARNFAVQHAGVSLANKDDQYFVDIGNFRNVYDFNQEVLRERDQFKVYGVNSTSYWYWDTDASREMYRQLRVSSDETFNNSRYVIAAVIINHVASAVNAARMAIAHNKNDDHSGDIEIRARPIGGLQQPSGMAVTFSKNF